MPSFARLAPRLLAPLLLMAIWPSDAAEAEPSSRFSITAQAPLGSTCGLGIWYPVEIQVTNHTASRVSGVVTIGNAPAVNLPTVRGALEVPAFGWAETVLDVPGDLCSPQVCFEAGGDPVCEYVSLARGAEATRDMVDVLIVSETIDLERAVSTNAPARGDQAGSSERRPAEVHVLPSLAQGLDLPDTAIAYQVIDLVAIEAPLLRRMSGPQERALADWVRVGGVVAVVARSGDEVLGSRWLEQLVGPIRAAEDGSWTTDCPGQVRLWYGESCAVGLGAVHLVAAIQAEQSNGEADLRSALQGVLAIEGGRTVPSPWQDVWDVAGVNDLWPLGARGPDRAIDVNASSQGALWWVFVLVVGGGVLGAIGAMRRLLRHGGRPWRLLATCAAIALAALAAQYGAAMAVRGRASRYRAVEWLEVAEGSDVALAVRRLGLFFATGGRRHLSGGSETLATTARGIIDQRGGSWQLEVSGHHWDTVHAREIGVVRLEGSVEAERDSQGRITAVRNGLGVPLADTVVVQSGTISRLGTVERGSARAVSWSPFSSAWPPYDDPLDPWFNVFLPYSVLPIGAEDEPDGGFVIGRVHLPCPNRGDFLADRCTSTLVVRVGP